MCLVQRDMRPVYLPWDVVLHPQCHFKEEVPIWVLPAETLMAAHKRLTSLELLLSFCLTTAGTSPRFSSNLSQFKAGTDYNYSEDGKSWGRDPGGSKTGAASLPQCLHVNRVPVASKGSLQTVSAAHNSSHLFFKMFLYIPTYHLPWDSLLCSYKLCCWQWKHRHASNCTEFRFTILTQKQRRELWQKVMVPSSWCHFCLQLNFQDSCVWAVSVTDRSQLLPLPHETWTLLPRKDLHLMLLQFMPKP